MTENGLFVLGGPETQLHDILWAVHDGKNRGRSEGEENIGVFPVTVGGRGRAMHGGLRVSLVPARACVGWWGGGGWYKLFRVGVDEQAPVVLPPDEPDPDRSSRLGLDEQDPVEG